MRAIYRQFAQLCESMMREDSTALQEPVIRSNPLASALITKLHTGRLLPHDAALAPYRFTTLAALNAGAGREHDRTKLLVLLGERGAAAIIVRPYRYNVITTRAATKEDDTDSVQNGVYYGKLTASTWKVLLDYIKSQIGRVSKNMLLANTAAVNKLHSNVERKKLEKTKQTSAVSAAGNLLLKFKPLFKKMIIQALANLHEDVRQNIKHHNYESARTGMHRSESLYKLLNQLDDEDIKSDMSDIVLLKSKHSESSLKLLGNAINSALLTVAYYYYPQEFDPDNMPRRGSPALFNRAVEKLLNDISSGKPEVDAQGKLVTVLNYFKRGLLIQ